MSNPPISGEASSASTSSAFSRSGTFQPESLRTLAISTSPDGSKRSSPSASSSFSYMSALRVARLRVAAVLVDHHLGQQTDDLVEEVLVLIEVCGSLDPAEELVEQLDKVLVIVLFAHQLGAQRVAQPGERLLVERL